MYTPAMLNHLRAILGSPRRYAYVSNPVTLYVNVNGRLEPKKYYSVDFVIACDLFDISSARGINRVVNPHVINIQEPNTDGSEAGSFVCHSVLLDEGSFIKLQQNTNRNGNLRRFDGVVNGYAVSDVRRILRNDSIIDTGLLLSYDDIQDGLIETPSISFDEKKHMRYIQASESCEIKLQKHRDKVVSKGFGFANFSEMYKQYYRY